MTVRPIDRPTLIERFVRLIPLPYPWAALVWSVILGPVSFLALEQVTQGFMSIPNPLNVVLNFALLMYLFLIVRHIRLRVVAAEERLAPRLAGGEEDFHRAFGHMTDALPVLGLSVLLAALFLWFDWTSGILAPTIALVTVNVIIVFLDCLGFITYTWSFAAASWGLYRLGKSSLQLGSFLEDRMLGARPLGTLALVLASAYFGLMLIIGLLFSTFLPGTSNLFITFALLIGLGIALFFLPLTSIHARMLMEKRRILRDVGTRYARHGQETPPPAEAATLEDVRTGLARLTNLQELEVLDRKASTLPTWPFDIQVVSRFVTIVLSVTAVLAARVITDFLHL